MAESLSARVDNALFRFLGDKAKLSVFEDVVMRWSRGDGSDKGVVVAYNTYRCPQDLEEE